MAKMPENTGKNMPNAVVYKGSVGQTLNEKPVYKTVDAGPFSVEAGLTHGITELGDSKAKSRHPLHTGKTSELNKIVFPHKKDGV